jgi:glucan phosphoethanolaminetransferase (alkaline phosphatase superfamily)
LLPIVPFVYGVVGVISYLENVVTPDIETLVTLISYFVPALLLAFAVQVFLLVLCLKRSKSKEDGNRYAE